MKDIKDMKDMETLREKELTKRNKRIQNTISLIRKLNCVIVAIAASLTFLMYGVITIIMREASL